MLNAADHRRDSILRLADVKRRTGLSEANSGAPVVLAAYGEKSVARLRSAAFAGHYVVGSAVERHRHDPSILRITDTHYDRQEHTMTSIDKQIIAGMTGVDKALWFAKRDGEKRGVSDRVELATRLGITHQAIHLFVKQGYLPRGRAQQVHDLYGVPLAELVKPA